MLNNHRYLILATDKERIGVRCLDCDKVIIGAASYLVSLSFVEVRCMAHDAEAHDDQPELTDVEEIEPIANDDG